MKKYRIEAEQKWLDKFNSCFNTIYEFGVIYYTDTVLNHDTVDWFNSEIAQGPAIELVEVNEPVTRVVYTSDKIGGTVDAPKSMEPFLAALGLVPKTEDEK